MARYLPGLFAAVMLAAPILPAHAGPYDGKWVVDFPPVDVRDANDSRSLCGPLRIVGEIKDNQLNALLQRSAVTGAVENSAAANAVPLTGTVQPDGMLAASWEKFQITGKLAANSGEVSVKSECGPRTGKAVRVQ